MQYPNYAKLPPNQYDATLPGGLSQEEPYADLAETTTYQPDLSSTPQIGFARNSSAREATIQPDGSVFVDMNDAAILSIPESVTAQILTASLAGCTGIAAIAETEDGVVAGVSHYDPMVDAFQREGSGCMSEKFMYQFVAEARRRGAKAVELVIAHDKSATASPMYGKKVGDYKDWYFLDQLETAAQYIGEDVQVQFLPYQGGNGHELAAVADSQSGENSIAFDRKRIID